MKHMGVSLIMLVLISARVTVAFSSEVSKDVPIQIDFSYNDHATSSTSLTESARVGERTDASGLWKYTLSNGGVTIIAYHEEGPLGALKIPAQIDGYPVTGIGDDVFAWRDGITSVTIPVGVTSIGNSAFFSCSSMTSVSIPNSVREIGVCAFASCDSLISVIVPEGVSILEQEVFCDCTSLASLTIPSSVTFIADWAITKSPNLVLTVTRGSYAERYAKQYNFPYRYPNSSAILNDPVTIIKTGWFDEYPQKTVGEAFDAFLGSISWESFNGNDGNTYVNATGYVLQGEKRMLETVQFRVYDDNRFDVTSFEVGGRRKDWREFDSFLSAVFR